MPRSQPLAHTLPDYALFRALPGAGPTFAPRLLAAFGEQRERYRQRRGTPEVLRHRARHRTQRQEVLGALATTVPDVPTPNVRRVGRRDDSSIVLGRSLLSAATCQGMFSPSRLRALAFKWIRILYRCWQNRTPYDESTYFNALKRRGSPLLDSIAVAT